MIIENQDILIHSLKALKLIKESRISKEIDLSKIDKITPFFIAPVTGFLKQNKEIRIVFPKNSYKKSYLQTLKFPQTTTSTITSKKSYIPLYEIKGSLGYDEENGEILDLLEKIIIDNFGLKENYQLLMSVFNELICNIQQHSKSKFNCIQAQMYRDKLAISLVDTGITIQSSYNSVEFKGEDDMELFKNAFAGVSTKKDKERGTGIPNTYNWICKGLRGSLVVISKNSAFKKLEYEENLEFIDLNALDLEFSGTIINILFKIPKEKIDIYSLINKAVE